MLVKEERQRRIIEWVNKETSINIADLQERLKVSKMTIWRDLQQLDARGILKKVHGGAMKKGGEGGPEPFFESKRKHYNRQKKLIAEYAAQHFTQENEIIILEGGTTVAGMVQFLSRSNLTIMSNGLATLARASLKLPTMSVISCGGILRDRSRTFVGPQAEAFFHDIHANKFFLGATGIDIERGITDPSPLEIQVKRAMHRCAEETILLIDSSKFNVCSLSQIIPLSEIDVIVTDSGAPQASLDCLRELGIQIHIAG